MSSSDHSPSQKGHVALFADRFLPYSQTFIYDEIQAHERYTVDVFCKERINEDRFPYDRVTVPSVLGSAWMGARVYENVYPTPNGLTATAGSGQVSLDWDGPSGSQLQRYRIYRSLAPIDSLGDSRRGLVRAGPTTGPQFFAQLTPATPENWHDRPRRFRPEVQSCFHLYCGKQGDTACNCPARRNSRVPVSVSSTPVGCCACARGCR